MVLKKQITLLTAKNPINCSWFGIGYNHYLKTYILVQETVTHRFSLDSGLAKYNRTSRRDVIRVAKKNLPDYRFKLLAPKIAGSEDYFKAKRFVANLT